MIRVKINGSSRQLDGPVPLAELVTREIGRDDHAGVAVGIDRQVVPRADWDKVMVDDGDEVEIIAPFAGG